MSEAIYVGIDMGTTGVRACAIEDTGAIVSERSGKMKTASEGEGVAAIGWQGSVEDVLRDIAMDGQIAAIAVDGTSGSMVLTDDHGTPVTPGLLYNSKGFDAEAERIAAVAPEGSITRGSGSALARLLRLQKLSDGRGRHLLHQADLASALLTGRPGTTDESNALKTGYDAANRRWPRWLEKAGVDMTLLPRVVPVGAPIGSAISDRADMLGVPASARVIAGATDSVAAFLAAGVAENGVAVTSLGTTLALKVLSDRPVEDAARGIYSHRVGDSWLPGGASNVGGGSLLAHFTAHELADVTTRIDPDWEPQHPATYPLTKPGERFPRNDPALVPNVPERSDDARFLFELLHAIARIEREGYEALASLGAPYPTRVLTTGGGAQNTVWTAIRQKVLGVPVEAMETADAAYGMALTAMRAVRPRD